MSFMKNRAAGWKVVKSISLPMELWEIILNHQKDSNQNISQTVATLIRHGAIRIKEKDLMYSKLSPTPDTDTISK